MCHNRTPAMKELYIEGKITTAGSATIFTLKTKCIRNYSRIEEDINQTCNINLPRLISNNEKPKFTQYEKDIINKYKDNRTSYPIFKYIGMHTKT